MTISIEQSSGILEKLDAFWDHVSTDPGLIPGFRVFNVDDVKYMTDATSGTHEWNSSLPLLLNHKESLLIVSAPVFLHRNSNHIFMVWQYIQ
jgi:hypothetical protein